MFTTSKRSAYVMIAVGLIGTTVSIVAANLMTTIASIVLAVVGTFAIDLE